MNFLGKKLKIAVDSPAPLKKMSSGHRLYTVLTELGPNDRLEDPPHFRKVPDILTQVFR